MTTRPKIYMDHAAATPLDPAVAEAMRPYLSDIFYNPSASYSDARKASQALEAARAQVAHWLGVRSAEIVFTAGGTEANNLALFGVAAKHEGAHMVSTALEHESILRPLEYLERHGWTYDLVRPSAAGLVDPESIAAAIDDRTVMVSVAYANNEIGTVQPIRQISRHIGSVRSDRLKRGVKRPLYFHTDACQAANYLDLHASRLGVDMMTLNGGKIYGPKQSGALYVKAGTVLEPLMLGGGQERGLRSGTENVAADVGFAKALDLAQSKRHEETPRLQELQRRFISQLAAATPEAVINGSAKQRLPNNVHVTFPGQDNERLLIQLDEAGILAAAGSACSADSGEPSHVMKAIGASDADARASLRFTMGRGTTASMVNRTVSTLVQLLSA